jgi:hypothetical protein
MTKQKGYIGVDFDGTLATYDRYRGPLVLGEPIKLMVERVKEWLRQGKNVKIFTARVSPDHSENDISTSKIAIQKWCKNNIGQELEVTCIKYPNMYEFWDDKAVSVEKNTGEII